MAPENSLKIAASEADGISRKGIPIRTQDERNVLTHHPGCPMSVDFLHVLIASLFLAMWLLVAVVLRPLDREEGTADMQLGEPPR